jgi:hypothetical protein
VSVSKRIKLPTDRLPGITVKQRVGVTTLYTTVNRDAEGKVRECFCKADEGNQAEADGLAGLVSIALQGGGYEEVFHRVVKFLRHRRYPPHGAPGGPVSISDALGRALEWGEEKKENGDGQ